MCFNVSTFRHCRAHLISSDASTCWTFCETLSPSDAGQRILCRTSKVEPFVRSAWPGVESNEAHKRWSLVWFITLIISSCSGPCCSYSCASAVVYEIINKTTHNETPQSIDRWLRTQSENRMEFSVDSMLLVLVSERSEMQCNFRYVSFFSSFLPSSFRFITNVLHVKTE